MKPFLMQADGDFDLQGKLPWNEAALTSDLGLDILFDTMARDDAFIRNAVMHAILSPLTDPEPILYRQEVLRDCLANPEVVRAIYELTSETIAAEKKEYWGLISGYPGSILHRSVDVLNLFVGSLRKLRAIADSHGPAFTSAGFRNFFIMLQHELDDDYFVEIQEHLRELRFRNGVLVSVGLGLGNKGTDYVLRKPRAIDRGWWRRIFAKQAPSFSFHLHPRDEAGSRCLAELKGRGINLAANALAQSNDHILSFFSQLRAEIAFYLGCLGLHHRLRELDQPFSFPKLSGADAGELSFKRLYDPCLALHAGRKVVGNDLCADGKALIIITGANQGGKTTFLRAMGIAQLMTQAGMFVAAEAAATSIRDSVITHYKREEDSAMISGKLDEELARMSDIVDHIRHHPIILFNESFSATNEREGSEIARQVVDALVETGARIAFVTHLYDLAHSFDERHSEVILFLRAERQDSGLRTFQLKAGSPLPTSYGEDMYHKIFGGASVHDRESLDREPVR